LCQRMDGGIFTEWLRRFLKKNILNQDAEAG
jgi:hypothetical protein